MKKNKEIQEELEGIAPFLAGMDKQEGFKVPQNYFEQLQNDVLDQVRLNTETTPVKINTVSWSDKIVDFFAALLQPRVALSFASIALLIVAGFIFMEDTAQTNFASISDEEAHNFISANIDDIDADYFLEAGLTDKDIDELSSTLFNEAGIDEYMDEIIEDIDDHLLEELL